jgi:hypothetical protein
VNYTRPPLWIYTTIIYLILIGLGLWRATVIVTAPSTRVRTRNGRNKPGPPTEEVVVDGTA